MRAALTVGVCVLALLALLVYCWWSL